MLENFPILPSTLLITRTVMQVTEVIAHGSKESCPVLHSRNAVFPINHVESTIDHVKFKHARHFLKAFQRFQVRTMRGVENKSDAQRGVRSWVVRSKKKRVKPKKMKRKKKKSKTRFTDQEKHILRQSLSFFLSLFLSLFFGYPFSHVSLFFIVFPRTGTIYQGGENVTLISLALIIRPPLRSDE